MPDWEKIKGIISASYPNNIMDVVFYNGPIERQHDHEFIHACRSRRRRDSVMLIIVTSGGDAHAGYRIGRCLQRCYDHVSVFVPGWCKSAGTLLAISGAQLFIGDFGELGPIDVQRAKPDELWQQNSGLTEGAAIEVIERAAIKTFETFVIDIKEVSGGQITFKTAAEVSSSIVAGLFEPILAQIDPMKIGENSRTMNIAYDYGMRLNLSFDNLKPNSMRRLVSLYSDHGFVIDRKEAEILFKNVSEPTEELESIAEALGEWAHFPMQQKFDEPATIRFLNDEPTKEMERGDDEAHGEQGQSGIKEVNL